MPTLHFDFVRQQARTTTPTQIDSLVVAGWTGRNAAMVEAHVRELAALGVPRPSRTPLFYRVSAQLLTTGTDLEVLGADSSGEAEAVIVGTPDGLWVGVGSDHTDRRIERRDVAWAKQCCAKAIGSELWPLEELSGHWDELVLRSYITTTSGRELYQEGALAGLQPPSALMRLYAGEGSLAAGTALFCGTLPVHGTVRGGTQFEIELADPVLRRVLRHSYALRELPIVC